MLEICTKSAVAMRFDSDKQFGAEYLENRMGLVITSVWRLLVFDIENVLDGVRHPPLHTAHSTSSWWSVSLGRLGRISTRTPCVAASLYRSAQACWDLSDCCDSCHSMLAAVWAPASSLASIIPVLPQVCDKVLGDKTVNRDTRKRRAEALRDLAMIFQVQHPS